MSVTQSADTKNGAVVPKKPNVGFITVPVGTILRRLCSISESYTNYSALPWSDGEEQRDPIYRVIKPFDTVDKYDLGDYDKKTAFSSGISAISDSHMVWFSTLTLNKRTEACLQLIDADGKQVPTSLEPLTHSSELKELPFNLVRHQYDCQPLIVEASQAIAKRLCIKLTLGASWFLYHALDFDTLSNRMDSNMLSFDSFTDAKGNRVNDRSSPIKMDDLEYVLNDCSFHDGVPKAIKRAKMFMEHKKPPLLPLDRVRSGLLWQFGDDINIKRYHDQVMRFAIAYIDVVISTHIVRASQNLRLQTVGVEEMFLPLMEHSTMYMTEKEKEHRDIWIINAYRMFRLM
jgi:hypothetical protein